MNDFIWNAMWGIFTFMVGVVGTQVYMQQNPLSCMGW